MRFVGYLFGAALGTVPALLLSALVAAISGVIVSRSLGRRLSPLEQTARKMADGDLTLRIEDTSPDEIGRVGQAFNQMAGQLQDSLQALEAEKGRVEALLHARRDLVANISHDLRTPIASLAAHLETLSEHPERLDAYLPILSDETDRVSGLIGDLFELSRLDARELELDLSPVALCDVIERVVTTYKETRLGAAAHRPRGPPARRPAPGTGRRPARRASAGQPGRKRAALHAGRGHRDHRGRSAAPGGRGARQRYRDRHPAGGPASHL